MPEQLTKHPEVTLQVLRSSGAKCGEGAAQDILSRCPPERFCKLPGGEVCVYGLPEATHMTQISPADWKALASRAEVGTKLLPRPFLSEPLLLGGSSLLVGLVVGVAVSRIASLRRSRVSPR